MWFDGLSTSRCFWGVIDERRAETSLGRPGLDGPGRMVKSRGLDRKISYLTKIWEIVKIGVSKIVKKGLSGKGAAALAAPPLCHSLAALDDGKCSTLGISLHKKHRKTLKIALEPEPTPRRGHRAIPGACAIGAIESNLTHTHSQSVSFRTQLQLALVIPGACAIEAI